MPIYHYPVRLYSGIYSEIAGDGTFEAVSLFKEAQDYLNNQIEPAPSDCAKIISIFVNSTDGWEDSVIDAIVQMTPKPNLDTYFTIPLAIYVLGKAVESLTQGV